MRGPRTTTHSVSFVSSPVLLSVLGRNRSRHGNVSLYRYPFRSIAAPSRGPSRRHALDEPPATPLAGRRLYKRGFAARQRAVRLSYVEVLPHEHRHRVERPERDERLEDARVHRGPQPVRHRWREQHLVDDEHVAAEERVLP